MEYNTAVKAAQLSSVKSSRKITGDPSRKASGFFLSDIHKIVFGEHRGPCYDGEWMYRYFEAALPHIIATRLNWQDAVRRWVVQHAPVLLIVEGEEWLNDQAQACATRGKRKGKRTPEADRLSALCGVTEAMVAAHGLKSIPATTRPKNVRKSERAAKGAERSRKKRVAAGAKPRSSSLMATKPWDKEGMKRTAWYAAKAAEKRALSETSTPEIPVPDRSERSITQAVSGTVPPMSDEPVPDRFERNISVGSENTLAGQIRAQHHIEYKTYIASPRFEETLPALKAGSAQAQAEFAMLDETFNIIFLEEISNSLASVSL